MFIGPIVIRDDGTRADIHPASQLRIAYVRKVVRLGALSQGGILHLDEITDVDTIRERRCRPEAGERPDIAGGPDDGAVDDDIGKNFGVVPDLAVADHAVRMDMDAITQLHVAFQYDVHIDEDIGSVRDRTAHVEARPVDDGDTGD